MVLKVSISGAPGAGKSTVVKNIVNKLGWDTADVGQIFRKRGLERGMTIAEYDKYIEKNPKEDIAMDEDFRNLVSNSSKNIIVSWRMGFHFMSDIITIYLDISSQEGAKRVFGDDRGAHENKYGSVDEALQSNTDRVNRLKTRIMDVYGVDFTDINNYNKIIDTTNKSIEQVTNEVLEYINNFKN